MLCDFCRNETSEANKVCHICGADTALSKSGLIPELYTNQLGLAYLAILPHVLP